MKKLLLTLTALLCTAPLMHATEQSIPEAANEHAQQQEESVNLDELDTLEQEETIDEVAKDIGIVRFTITLFKDRQNHDPLEWQSIITKAAQTLYRLQGEHADHTDILRELNEIVDALQNNQLDNGIAGELTVEASDGQPSKDCCGKDCRCAQMYRGNCPCSLNAAASNRCIPIPDEDDIDLEEIEESGRTQDSFEDVDLNEEVTTKSKCCCK
jgi:hypothetical protein